MCDDGGCPYIEFYAHDNKKPTAHIGMPLRAFRTLMKDLEAEYDDEEDDYISVTVRGEYCNCVWTEEELE